MCECVPVLFHPVHSLACVEDIWRYYGGGTVLQWLALSPHAKKVLGLIPSQGPSVWSLHVLPESVWVLSRFSRFRSHPKAL